MAFKHKSFRTGVTTELQIHYKHQNRHAALSQHVEQLWPCHQGHLSFYIKKRCHRTMKREAKYSYFRFSC